METRSKGKHISNTPISTRSSAKSSKARELKLKALYHSSLSHTTDSNSSEEREPTRTTSSHQSNIITFKETSMSPIQIMSKTDSNDELTSTITPDKPQDTPTQFTNEVEATADEVTETAEQREARRKAHPMKDIQEPLPTDCLFGRGGGTNHHPGNKLYRKMVEDKKEFYLNSKRLDKPLVAMEIIKEWRDLDPPGRFLKQDEVTKLWCDVGDKKAREKTSQALREKSVKEREDDDCDKKTRFETGTKLQRGNLITRDHSLGTEIVGNNDYFSMEGFSWDEQQENVERTSPYVRQNSANLPANHPMHQYGGYRHPSRPPPPHHHYGPPLPPPHFPSPHHPYYPPQHDYQAYRPPSGPSHDRGRNNSLSMNPLPGASTSIPATNSFEDEKLRSSWGHAPSHSYDGRAPPPLPSPHYYGYAPPPPGWEPPHYAQGSPSNHQQPSPPSHPHNGQPAPQSAFEAYGNNPQYYDQTKLAGSPQDFTKIAVLMSQDEDKTTHHEEKFERRNSNRSIDRSSSWGGYEKKQSLVLRDTSIGSFAPFDVPDDEEGNEFFDESVIQRSKSMPFTNNPNHSEDYFPSPPQPLQTRKKFEYIKKDVDAEKSSLMRKISGGSLRNTATFPLDGAVRPDPVKRETSNQSESMETKRQVKRVVLSRDMSAVSRSLKEEQSQKAPPLRADLIDRNLSVEINKLGLGDRPTSLGRLTTDQMLSSLLDDDLNESSLLESKPLTVGDRITTVDVMAMGIPAGDREQSCDIDDALELIMEDDKGVDAPSAVNEDIAAKWLKGESFAEDDPK